MKIRIRLHMYISSFDPSVHLNAYGPLIVAKLPTPTITDHTLIATSFTKIGCWMTGTKQIFEKYFMAK